MLVSEIYRVRPIVPSVHVNLLPARVEVEAEQVRRRLHKFAKSAFPVVEPGTPYSDNWHIEAICEHLEFVSQREIRKLIINIPPRHMKSLLVAVMWPAWEWLDHPESKFMFVSYADALSTRDSMKCRRLIKTTPNRFVHPDEHTLLEQIGYQGLLQILYGARGGKPWELAADQDAKKKFETTRAGYRLATSVDGVATGEGGDYVAIDDPHKAAEVVSDVIRQNVLDWHDATIPTRFNDPKRGAEVVVMQRLHERDLTGHLLEQGGWTHLCLPAEYEPKHPFVWPDDPRHEEGELLWPHRVGQAELDDLKKQMRHLAAGQLQQRPAPAEGILFKRKDFRYWTTVQRGSALYYVLHGATEDEPDRHVDAGVCTVFQTVDVAASEKQTADYTVVGTWRATPRGELLLLKIDRQQFDELQVPAFLKRINDEHGRPPMFIEDFGAGRAPLKKLRQDGYPVRRLEHEQGTQLDKIARAFAAYTAYEDHLVFHPVEHSEWRSTYETELTTFPAAANDDQVDVVAYAARLRVTMGAMQTMNTEPKGRPLSAGIMDAQF